MYIVIMKCMDIGVPAAPKHRRERPQARRAHCPADPGAGPPRAPSHCAAIAVAAIAKSGFAGPKCR